MNTKKTPSGFTMPLSSKEQIGTIAIQAFLLKLSDKQYLDEISRQLLNSESYEKFEADQGLPVAGAQLILLCIDLQIKQMGKALHENIDKGTSLGKKLEDVVKEPGNALLVDGMLKIIEAKYPGVNDLLKPLSAPMDKKASAALDFGLLEGEKPMCSLVPVAPAVVYAAALLVYGAVIHAAAAAWYVEFFAVLHQNTAVYTTTTTAGQ